jgi:hypothetical protein
MKLLFLDFDGVLNSYQPTKVGSPPPGWEDRQPPQSSGINPRGLLKELDVDKVALLNDIVSSSGCKVVVSSAWRLQFSLEELRWLLEGAGFVGDVVGVTPDHSRRPKLSLSIPGVRGLEIEAYLLVRDFKENPKSFGRWMKEFREASLEGLVILDDLEYSGGVGEYWVKTDPYVGLTPEDVQTAKDILNAGLLGEPW